VAKDVLVNKNYNKNEIQNVRIQNLAVAPLAPVLGQLYFDTVLNAMRNWDGAAWTLPATDSLLLQGQNGAYYRARANHTGTQLAATISDFDTQVRTNRLDQMADPTADVDLNNQKIINLANGTVATDAAAFGQIATALNARRFAQTIGDGAATSFTITHNLGTQDIEIKVYNTSTNAVVEAEESHPTINTAVVSFTVAPSAGQFRVVILS